MTTADIILVGCVGQKAESPTFARDVYTSTLFRKRRAYAEASGKPWFILSALHGLLRPAERVVPYDFTMAEHDAHSTKLWALGVALSLYRIAGRDVDQLVEVHAGEAYWRPLRRPLSAASFTMTTPLRGLGIGQQLAWYGSGRGE